MILLLAAAILVAEAVQVGVVVHQVVVEVVDQVAAEVVVVQTVEMLVAASGRTGM